MKFKLNAIIGKKQIVLASLVLILGVAVYLNWQFANSDQSMDITDVLNNAASDSSSENYGEAELVDSGVSSDDYFTNARLEKQQSRDEATETLAQLLQNANLSVEEQANATAEALSLAQLIEKEASIENLIMAKGFEECIAYLDNDTANIVVKVTDMTAEQAAQIKDIVVTETSISASNIVVTPVE